MKHKLMIIAILLCHVLMTRSENALIVYTADQKPAVFLLSDTPKISVEDNIVTVSNTAMTLTYTLDVLERFVIADAVEVNIHDVSSAVLFHFEDNQLTARGLDAGEVVRLYNTSGVLLRQYVADSNGSIRVSVPTEHGTYLIKSKNKTFKTTFKSR